MTEPTGPNACSLPVEAPVAAPEPEVEPRRRPDGARTVSASRRKTQPSPTYRRKRLRRSGFPRIERGIRHTVNGRPTPEAAAWGDFLARLVERVRLPVPIPDWALDDVRRAAYANLAERALQARLLVETNLAEIRKLRSQARREGSTRAMAERALRATLAELRSAEAARVPTLADLLQTVGRP